MVTETKPDDENTSNNFGFGVNNESLAGNPSLNFSKLSQ